MSLLWLFAAGTPVLAIAHGAAPEIVQDGINGFLVKDEDEMAAFVERAGEIDPLSCRRSVERFAPHRDANTVVAPRIQARAVTVAITCA